MLRAMMLVSGLGLALGFLAPQPLSPLTPQLQASRILNAQAPRGLRSRGVERLRMCAPDSARKIEGAGPGGVGGKAKVPEDIYIKAQKLSDAVRLENFALAAELRDEVKELRSVDKLSFLLEELRNSVAEEEFDQAASLKLKLAAELAERSRNTLDCRLQGVKGGRVRVNRLLALTQDSELLTCSPDGSASVDITGDSGSLGFGVDSTGGKFFQPTWSPSGDLVAATVIAVTDQAAQQQSVKTSKVLIMWAQDGSAMSQVEAPFTPFYYFWSDDSTRLSYLTTYADGPGKEWQVSLDLIRVLQEPETKASIYDVSMTHLEDGVPLFYSQCPRDKRMVVHVGDKRKIFVTEPAALGAEELVLSTRPGNFRAPQWLSRRSSSNSELVVFVEESADGKRQEVVVSDARGGTGPKSRRSLTEVSGFTSITVSPDGQRMALLLGKDLEQELCILEGPFELEEDPWPVDLEPIGAYTNFKEDLTSARRRVLGFFWSPDSRKLLYLTVPEKDDIVASGGGSVDIHWEVVDVVTRGHWVFERHIPSHAFLTQFLPFFDQYAQSQSLWSPDSDKFCYAGRGADGSTVGAWVQEVPGKNEEIPPPKLVVPGAQVVSWSPC